VIRISTPKPFSGPNARTATIENVEFQMVWNGWLEQRIVAVGGDWSLTAAILEMGSTEASIDPISTKFGFS
jgi:hypothetical protein